MGILLYSHAVAFAEDLEIEYEPNESPISFYGRAFGKYESAVCWRLQLFSSEPWPKLNLIVFIQQKWLIYVRSFRFAFWLNILYLSHTGTQLLDCGLHLHFDVLCIDVPVLFCPKRGLRFLERANAATDDRWFIVCLRFETFEKFVNIS